MTKLSHNPHTYLSVLTTRTTHMFLSSSIGIITIGMGPNFKKYHKMIEILALLILIYSIIYGFKSLHDFSNYITYLNTLDLPEPYSFQIKEWPLWIYLSYTYIFIISIIAVILFMKKIKN
jgi:hypothetical protein